MVLVAPIFLKFHHLFVDIRGVVIANLHARMLKTTKYGAQSAKEENCERFNISYAVLIAIFGLMLESIRFACLLVLASLSNLYEDLIATMMILGNQLF